MNTTIKNNTVFLHNYDFTGDVTIRQNNTDSVIRIPILDLKAFLNEIETDDDEVQLASVDDLVVGDVEKNLLAEIEEYDKRQEAAMVELNLTDRQKQFYAAADKVRNEIDYSKHGAITESLMRFAQEMNGVTYTELNMFYYQKTYETYDSVRDRGGSLTKHLASLRNYSRRVYSGIEKYMFKQGKLWVCSYQN
jgi:hypothetical protein